MTQADIDLIAAALVELNRQLNDAEQRGEDGKPFLTTRLSDSLIFRRANGKVVGKTEVLAGLGANPFKTRTIEEIDAHVIADRALVTLIVVGTRKDDGSVHRYRNARFFTRAGGEWLLDAWYNFEVTSL